VLVGQVHARPGYDGLTVTVYEITSRLPSSILELMVATRKLSMNGFLGRLDGKQPRVPNMLVEDHFRPAAVKAGVPELLSGRRYGSASTT